MPTPTPPLSLLAVALDAWAQLPDALASSIVPAERPPAPDRPVRRAPTAGGPGASAEEAGRRRAPA